MLQDWQVRCIRLKQHRLRMVSSEAAGVMLTARPEDDKNVIFGRGEDDKMVISKRANFA